MLFDRNNIRFDSRIDGVDDNGNYSKGKFKKDVKKPRREETNNDLYDDDDTEVESDMKFVLYTAGKDDYDEDVKPTRTLRDDDKILKKQNQKTQNVSKGDSISDKLINFVNEYTANKLNFQYIRGLISNKFPEVASIMANYNNDKYEDAIPAMNKIIVLMSTESFSKNLLNTLRDGTLETDMNTKANLMRTMNVLLESNFEKLSDEVAATYVDMVSNQIADTDIKIMAETYGMDEDTALDMAITVPISVIPTKTDSDMRLFARRFIDVILTDSDDTIKYADSTLQKNLFTDIFGDRTLKAVGQCLVANEIKIDRESDEGNVKGILLDNYVSMLYEILNDNDIPTIQIPLKFILKDLKRRDECDIEESMIFNADYIINNSNYDNIRKAIIDLCRNDELAAKYFI